MGYGPKCQGRAEAQSATDAIVRRRHDYACRSRVSPLLLVVLGSAPLMWLRHEDRSTQASVELFRTTEMVIEALGNTSCWCHTLLLDLGSASLCELGRPYSCSEPHPGQADRSPARWPTRGVCR